MLSPFFHNENEIRFHLFKILRLPCQNGFRIAVLPGINRKLNQTKEHAIWTVSEHSVQRWNDKNEKESTIGAKIIVMMKDVQHLNDKNDKEGTIGTKIVVKMKAEPPVQPGNPSPSKVKPSLGSATHFLVDQQRGVSVPSNREVSVKT